MRFLGYGPATRHALAVPEPPARLTGVTMGDAMNGNVEWTELLSGVPSGDRVTRAEILRVPAMVRAIEILSHPATLPVHVIGLTGEHRPWSLLDQPEVGLVRSVTLARTWLDLLMDAEAAWLVLERDSEGWPTSVKRLDVGFWHIDPDGRITALGKERNPGEVIVFTSPRQPLTLTAAGTVRAALKLAGHAALNTAEPEGHLYFSGPEADETEIQDHLDRWKALRRKGITGYVPDMFELKTVQRQTAAEMLLVDQRNFLIQEAARVTGVDVVDLSLGPAGGSESYANAQDRRIAARDAMAPITVAVEERLSRSDVTPRGSTVKFTFEGFLRGNSTERAAFYKTMIELDIMTPEECRALEDLPRRDTNA